MTDYDLMHAEEKSLGMLCSKGFPITDMGIENGKTLINRGKHKNNERY